MKSSPSRRNVLKIGAGAVAAAMLKPISVEALEQPDTARKRPIKKAVMWDMIKGPHTVVEKFKILKEAGFDGVEMNSPGGPPNDEVKRACDETGILIEGMVDSVHWKDTLSDPDPNVRASGLKALERALRDCKELGGTSVLLVPGVVNSRISYDQCYERSHAEILKAIPLARELGVKIAVEDVWNDFLLSPLEAARYIDSFEAPDAIGWHMDIGNVMRWGYPEQWIRILGKRIVKLHVKGFSRAKMYQEGLGKGFDVQLDEGDIDWAAVMHALDEVPYNTWMCAEVGGGALGRMKDISRRMDRILAL